MSRPIRLIASLALALWLSLSSAGVASGHTGNGAGQVGPSVNSNRDQARGQHALPIEEHARRHVSQAGRNAAAAAAAEARGAAARQTAALAAARKAAQARTVRAAAAEEAAAKATSGKAASGKAASGKAAAGKAAAATRKPGSAGKSGKSGSAPTAVSATATGSGRSATINVTSPRAVRTTMGSLARTPVAKGRSVHRTVLHPRVAAPTPTTSVATSTNAGGASTALQSAPPARQFLPTQTPAGQSAVQPGSYAVGNSSTAGTSDAPSSNAPKVVSHPHGASTSPPDSTAQDIPYRATATPAQGATASLVAVVAIFVVLVGLMVVGAGHRGSRDIR